MGHLPGCARRDVPTPALCLPGHAGPAIPAASRRPLSRGTAQEMSPRVSPRRGCRHGPDAPEELPFFVSPSPTPAPHPAPVVPTSRVGQRHTPGRASPSATAAPPRPIPCPSTRKSPKITALPPSRCPGSRPRSLPTPAGFSRADPSLPIPIPNPGSCGSGAGGAGAPRPGLPLPAEPLPRRRQREPEENPAWKMGFNLIPGIKMKESKKRGAGGGGGEVGSGVGAGQGRAAAALSEAGE